MPTGQLARCSDTGLHDLMLLVDCSLTCVCVDSCSLHTVKAAIRGLHCQCRPKVDASVEALQPMPLTAGACSVLYHFPKVSQLLAVGTQPQLSHHNAICWWQLAAHDLQQRHI